MRFLLMLWNTRYYWRMKTRREMMLLKLLIFGRRRRRRICRATFTWVASGFPFLACCLSDGCDPLFRYSLIWHRQGEAWMGDVFLWTFGRFSFSFSRFIKLMQQSELELELESESLRSWITITVMVGYVDRFGLVFLGGVYTSFLVGGVSCWAGLTHEIGMPCAVMEWPPWLWIWLNFVICIFRSPSCCLSSFACWFCGLSWG